VTPRVTTVGIVVALVVLTSAPRAIHAQEFEPRTYAVAPVNLNFIGIGYGFATGGVFLDPALPVDDVEGDVHVVVTRYVRTLGLFDRPSKVKLVLPWSSGDWKGFLEEEFRTRSATGLADARVIVETLFHGAEVMTRQEMQGYAPGTVFGARLQVIVPVGDYDNTKAINLGTNRWSFVPELGLSTPLGKWGLEATVGAWFFTENDDYFNGQRREQDPLLVAKLHAVRTIRPGFWWSLAAGYGYGARTTVDGIPLDTIQRNWRVFAMVAFPITAQQGVSVSIGSGGNAGAGTDFDAITVGYQFGWGGS
jgi:hypothetical protein